MRLWFPFWQSALTYFEYIIIYVRMTVPDSSAAGSPGVHDSIDVLEMYMKIAMVNGKLLLFFVIGIVNLNVFDFNDAFLIVDQLLNTYARCGQKRNIIGRIRPDWNFVAIAFNLINIIHAKLVFPSQARLHARWVGLRPIFLVIGFGDAIYFITNTITQFAKQKYYFAFVAFDRVCFSKFQFESDANGIGGAVGRTICSIALLSNQFHQCQIAIAGSYICRPNCK